MKRFFALVLVFGLAVSLAFAAEDTIKLRTLGQSPLTKPVLDAATAKQVVKNYAEEIRKLENDALFFDLMEQLDQAEFENEIPPIGTVMRWMLFKDRKGVIRNLKNVEWVGQEQFQAFGFEILHEGMIYHFFVPKICGNICLSQIRKALPPPPPPKPIEPPKPAEPKTVTPVVIIPPPVLISPQPAPAQPPAKKHRPDFKLKFGPWIPWEPMTFSAENQNVDVQYNFNDYLPKYEKFVICEDEETGTIYLNEKNFPYQTGDSVWLKKQRSLQTSWTGIQFNVGLEIRIWKNLRLGADYYRSRKLHVNVSENTEDMYFKEVKYLGYYSTADESLISCPPKYHRYCLELNRRALERQTEYTIMSQEIHLLLRYYLNIGRFSLAPSFGIADQQFLIKTTNNTVSTVLYPWKDKVISQTERTEYKTEKDNYQVALTGKFAVEYKLLSPSVRIAAEVSYQKFPEQKLIHESTISPNLNFDFGSKPLRGSVALKIAF